MQTVFVLNGLQGRDREVGGVSAAALTLERVKRCFPDVLVLLPEGGDLPGVTVLRPARPDACSAFTAVLEARPEAEVYLFGDLHAPLLEPALGERFAALTVERTAHYTYGEHYPLGVAPHALSRECLQVLRNVASGNYTPMDDEAFMDLIGLDINNYDIEVDVSPDDFRRSRLDLRARGAAQVKLLENIAAEAGRPLAALDYPALSEILKTRPELHRTLPGYVELDLSENCTLACNFCPRGVMGLSGKQDGRVLDKKLALSVIDQLADLNPEAWLALSPYSEPLLSPHFREVVTHAVERGLKVLVETNGIGLDAGMIAFLKAFPEGAVTTVVSLDVLSGEEYARLKGADHFAQVTTAIRELATVRPRDTYVQVLNMDELTTVIDGFYDFWADLQDRVLPRKYNSFCGRLPERSTTDLSPLTRFPCWHLKRDMVIRADGTVGLCKQDLDRAWFSGDLKAETLAAVWERLGEAFARHAREEGWAVAPCGTCDEWHTYNF